MSLEGCFSGFILYRIFPLLKHSLITNVQPYYWHFKLTTPPSHDAWYQPGQWCRKSNSPLFTPSPCKDGLVTSAHKVVGSANSQLNDIPAEKIEHNYHPEQTVWRLLSTVLDRAAYGDPREGHHQWAGYGLEGNLCVT